MFSTVTIERTLYPASADDALRERMINYWHGRGFDFGNTEEEPLIGFRGSLWGNLISWEATELRTSLTITRPDPSLVLCQMQVDTYFQIVTEWDQEYWNLEMDAFVRLLKVGHSHSAYWDDFMTAYRESVTTRKLSLGFRGNTLPPSLRLKADHAVLLRVPEVDARSERLLRPGTGSTSLEADQLLRPVGEDEAGADARE
jgi:hypothetical protein